MAARCQRRRRLSRACRAMRSVSSRTSRSRSSLLVSRNSRSGSGSSACWRSNLSSIDLETCAAVERPGIAPQLDPVARRFAQVAHRQDRLAVLLDPAPQAGPLAEQGLVRELDRGDPGPGVAVERQQPCLRPTVDHGVDGGSHTEAGELRSGSASPGRPTLGSDDHEALEHPSHRKVFVVVER